MNVSIKERLFLFAILPQEGDIVTLKAIKKLQNELAFNEEEIKTHKINRKTDRSYEWESDCTKEIILTDQEKELFAERLKDLNSKKKLPIDLLELYGEIVGVE